MEKWTQVDYYGFANLFARVSVKEDDSMAGKGDTATVFSTPDGDILHPRLGVPMAPRPLDGMPMPATRAQDRRAYLAQWTTSPANTLFSRAVVNRVWANFFGRGLVHPVDDLRFTNPASNEPLFEAVTAEFVREGFDIKALIRHIMTSAAYQRAAATTADNAKDDRFYSHYLIRRLPAEVILDAFSQVTGVPQTFMRLSGGHAGPSVAGYARRLVLPQRLRASGARDHVGSRADAGSDAAAGAARDQRRDAERQAESRRRPRGEARARGKRRQRGDRRAVPVGAQPPAQLAPSATGLLARLGSGAMAGSAEADRRARLEDLAWAILTSREFLFNH